jgi:hypothetical protein
VSRVGACDAAPAHAWLDGRTPRYSPMRMRHLLDQIPWQLALMAALTLGLAPFKPPHIVEKLDMLFKGTLVKPIDWLDLVLHGTPWLIVILKGAYELKR